MGQHGPAEADSCQKRQKISNQGQTRSIEVNNKQAAILVKLGQTRSNEVKWGKKESNGDNWDQLGINLIKQAQTSLIGVKWGHHMVDQMSSSNRVIKWDPQTGPQIRA